MTAGYERAGDGWRGVLRDGRRKVWACSCKPHKRRYSRWDGDRSAAACACDELQRRTTPERAAEVRR